MAQNRVKSARIRVETEVSERQLLPGAAVQPNPQEANANARLGSGAPVLRSHEAVIGEHDQAGGHE